MDRWVDRPTPHCAGSRGPGGSSPAVRRLQRSWVSLRPRNMRGVMFFEPARLRRPLVVLNFLLSDFDYGIHISIVGSVVLTLVVSFVMSMFSGGRR